MGSEPRRARADRQQADRSQEARTMKKLQALKKIGVIASMWWIIATVNNVSSGPSMNPVRMWLGPWDSQTICERQLSQFRQGVDAAWYETFNAPTCTYNQSY
jgi:hypothetical protein